MGTVHEGAAHLTVSLKRIHEIAAARPDIASALEVAAIAASDGRVAVDLLSIDGRPIATVKIAPMSPWPEVIGYRGRVFVINDRTNPDPHFVPTYREGHMVHVIADEHGRQLY